MTTVVRHSSHLAVRNLRILYRQPVYLAFTLVQPMVWLLLFSQLFERVVDLPGFGDVSYVAYLAPGVIVMTAMMNAGWAGTSLVDDMDRGVMDRYLASPVRRVAIINGILAYQAAVTVVQSLIVLGVALAMGGFECGAEITLDDRFAARRRSGIADIAGCVRCVGHHAGRFAGRV